MEGGAVAGRLSSFAPAPLPPIVWALKPPLWALHILGLSLANICVNAHVGMLVCTRIMLVCTRRPLQGGLLYIKPPMIL